MFEYGKYKVYEHPLDLIFLPLGVMLLFYGQSQLWEFVKKFLQKFEVKRVSNYAKLNYSGYTV